ncbi:glycosyltransferase family 2 protein [Metabacillus sp. FJAT-53654]|uniref:Glycosyltransferase family 2 protein n=1 Tax=Metabacillus rhizosphaerae TaxID=3117747 RepID=A0ABZ2MZU2_9BACI
MSKVSVVVPIYNAGKKLNKCIKSILNQTFKDFELILVNDGSIDNSLNICKKFQKKDKRIIVIDKQNEGSIATRRKGVEASNSEYVMFVDADDWIDSKTIEILYDDSIEGSVDITVCNMYKILGNGKIFKKKNNSRYFNKEKIYNEEEIKSELVTAYFWGHPFPPSLCAKMYKKELLLKSGKYLDRIRFLGEDLYYNMEILIKSNKVKVIDRALYYYRVGGFTSKYMPYLFEDMVNGYLIQKEVIDEYYQNTYQEQYDGISIMLLNTFKTCLYNLFNGELTEGGIKELIREYVSNDKVIECLTNKGSEKYFQKDYLNAIKDKNILYLFELGESMYKKKKLRRVLVSTASKLSII